MSFIKGLPALIAKQESKSVYANLFSTLSMAIDFLYHSISNNNNNSLTVFTNKETLLSSLNSHSECKLNKLIDNHIKSVHFLVKKRYSNTPNTVQLSKDIHRLNVSHPKNAHYILLINESMLSNSTVQEIEAFLNNINQFAIKREATVMLCLYGHLGMVDLKSKLLTLNRSIAGLSSMTSLDEQRFYYAVKYWSNSYGVTVDEEYVLALNSQNELKATQHKKVHANETIENKPDSHICYINKTALIQNKNPSKGMLVAESNQQLLTMLDNPQAATIIFSCTSQSEIQELAINCYQLRSNFGNQLKIIIREVQQCLRYTDEKLLLRAGVNLIVPNQVPFPRFMTQVEAIQGQVINRSLPVNLETLLKYNLKYGNKGYLQSNDFIQYGSSVINRSLYSTVDFALIKLTLLPGMTAEECLRLCHIRRDGDVVTATNNALYVLFSAIRKNDIDIAINHIFEFPVRDLFQSFVSLDTKEEIEVEMRYIIENSVNISDEVCSLTTQKKIFSPSPRSLTDVPVLFAVKQTISTNEPV